MSASRMDKYKSCHFSYFMRYGLQAEPRKPAGFTAPEYGTFVHYVLEHVLQSCPIGEESWGEELQKRLRAAVRAAVDRYTAEELGQMQNELTGRLRPGGGGQRGPGAVRLPIPAHFL